MSDPTHTLSPHTLSPHHLPPHDLPPSCPPVSVSDIGGPGGAALVCDTTGPDRGEVGQATAEYALVLLGAAAVALLLIGWATTTDQISRLFDFVIEQVIGRSG